MIGGCSHGVLTFFFTGVPDPSAPQAVVSESIGKEDGDIDSTPVNRRVIATQDFYTHGPWVNRQCELCHVSTSGQRFNSAITKNVSPQLAYDKADLCVGCHVDERFSQTNQKYWMHGPAINGRCTYCHEPHSSRNPFMLKAANTQTLCGQCHGSGALHNAQPHEEVGDTECTACHDAHGSARRMLLLTSQRAGEP